MRILMVTLGAAALLAGCNSPVPPMTGGPCSYETTILTASVTETDEDGALFEGEEGEFWVPAEYLRRQPKVGETLTLRRDRITEGTCTPEIYAIADADVSDQD